MEKITKEIADFTIGFAVFIHDRDAYLDKDTLKELFLEYTDNIEKENNLEENDSYYLSEADEEEICQKIQND